jgi:hypothetical protein
LISNSRSFFTAGIARQPGRALTCSGLNFLPHQEASITSGFRLTTSAASETMRPDAAWERDWSEKISSPPAISMSSLTQRMPLIIGSSHSSK